MSKQPKEMQIRAIDIITMKDGEEVHVRWRIEQYVDGLWRPIEILIKRAGA